MTRILPLVKSFFNGLILLVLTTSLALAETSLPNTVEGLQSELDVVNFDLPKKGNARLKRLAVLILHAEALAKENIKDASFQMMAGFFNAQYAGYKGGVGALKYAKASRRYLEESIKLDPTVYEASAHVILGSLYAQLPRWPISFGNKKKAIKNFQTALKLSPNGIDANFNYSKFLIKHGKLLEAKIHLEKAALAPVRPYRQRSDESLHKRIVNGLALIEKNLSL